MDVLDVSATSTLLSCRSMSFQRGVSIFWEIARLFLIFMSHSHTHHFHFLLYHLHCAHELTSVLSLRHAQNQITHRSTTIRHCIPSPNSSSTFSSLFFPPRS